MVHSPPSNDESRPDLGALLSEEFLERTKGRGLELVNATDVRAESRVGWCVRESLQVELGARGSVC